jgi:hypothetical protein
MYAKFMYMSLFVLENAIFDFYHVGYAWLLFRSLHHSPLMMTHCQRLTIKFKPRFPKHSSPLKISTQNAHILFVSLLPATCNVHFIVHILATPLFQDQYKPNSLLVFSISSLRITCSPQH